MLENDISYAIRGAAFKVNAVLGPGLLESVYETALEYELKKAGYEVSSQVAVPMKYGEVMLMLVFGLT